MKRKAVAMIELIFAIVVIAISVLSIPSMMRIADQHAKMITIDDDVVARLLGWTKNKFQARWDQNYQATDSGILNITANPDTALACVGGYRVNTESNVPCSLNLASGINPLTSDGNLSRGLEQLHGGTETLRITPTGGEPYNIFATYRVNYVASNAAITAPNAISTTWSIGSSDKMNDYNVTTAAANATHLKRVVTEFYHPDLQADVVLTFFKSNKGN